jgi:transcriptional regulator GlxA family with amidase domain
MSFASQPTHHCDLPANIVSYDVQAAAPVATGELGRQVSTVLETMGLEQAALRPVAAQLAMSTRTLERRLAAQGLTFAGLVDAHRRERALCLLRQTDLSMEQVATELGFSGAKNFSRTFRRWYGVTPSRMRKMPVPAALLYQGTACGSPAESLQLSHR